MCAVSIQFLIFTIFLLLLSLTPIDRKILFRITMEVIIVFFLPKRIL